MSQAARVVNTLKSILRTQRKTYKEIAEELGLTEAGVKKALSSDSLSLSRVESICTLLGMSLLDLMHLTKDEEDDKQLLLTLEQEKTLAKDEELFAVYCLILTGLDVETIASDYKFKPEQLHGHLRQLDKIGLIALVGTGTFRLKSATHPIWLENGPLIKLHGAKLTKEYVLEADSNNLGYQRFMHGRLDAAAVEVLKKKMQQLEIDFSLLCSPKKKSRGKSVSVAVYHGIKPWKYSVVEKYRRAL